jgi:hypothetical protein
MELPLEGSSTILSFLPDDTIETVRQTVALAKQTHPDRLFIQIQLELPKDYYSTNPKRWADLFLRMSHGKNSISSADLDIYVTQVRPGTGVSARDVSREDWNAVEEFLQPLFAPEASFKEWRILGVSEETSAILPLPPADTVVPEIYRPTPVRQRLFETAHPEEAVAIMATEIDPETTDLVKQLYFPFFQSSTPPNIEMLRAPMKAARDRLSALMRLKAPQPKQTSILRAKWYIPLISTKFTAPRVRFEQIFYGLTVSKKTPVVSYFTSKGEAMRHKFYVEDPKTKEPFLDVPLWKAWTANTQPQRRLPTLLLYRGTSSTSFDRIAITNKDITASTWRNKDSTETLEDLQESLLEWMKTLDAVMPFLVETDIQPSRWTLNDLTAEASFAKEISEFDMRRFDCLQDLFGYQDTTFRLLRADRDTDIPEAVLNAYALLKAQKTLETELKISKAEADAFKEQIRILEEEQDVNLDNIIRSYPVIAISSKDIRVKFVKNLDRAMNYASILRYVLTSDKEEVNAVCPRRLEVVAPIAGVATTAEVQDDFDLGDLMEEIEQAKQDAPSNAAAAPAVLETMTKVKKGGPLTTHNYFNNRIDQIDPDLVDADYSKKCEKLAQVVILTPEDQARIPEAYNYSKAPENEKLPLEKGVAICPQYWCIRDEIPLSEDQLVTGPDNTQHCPECNGKVRITDKEDAREFTVIKRKQENKYPGFKNPTAKSTSKKKMPCCYLKPSGTAATAVLGSKTDIDDYYVLSSGVVPPLRIAYLPDELAKRLGIKTNYDTTCPRNRMTASATDMFRVGVGLPRESLPTLLNIKRAIPTPANARDKILQCSFFRTWTALGEGVTLLERITQGIDKAYRDEALSSLQEIEYVALVLDCRVMRINTALNTMSCGFWADKTSAQSRTIVLLDTDVVGKVTRRAGNLGTKFDYVIDVNKFDDTAKSTMQRLHVQACSAALPTMDDAVNELMLKNISNYQVILDPFERVQAVFVPQQAVLPVQPVSTQIPEGVPVRSGYSDVREGELPTQAILAAFLAETRNKGFKQTETLAAADGMMTEFLLESGFRAPFRPEGTGNEPAQEVIQTVQAATEEMLVSAKPNAEDLRMASDITYSSEVYEFLMFSLSKDLETADHETLRNSVKTPGPDLYKDLKAWLDANSIWDQVNEPVQFVNKVRTPCGQLLEDSCKSSSLCGWHEGTCKIKVKSVVDKRQVLVRMAKTLKENTKQRALVLDGRLSPFFSTILYLEMPHELITSDV